MRLLQKSSDKWNIRVSRAWRVCCVLLRIWGNHQHDGEWFAERLTEDAGTCLAFWHLSVGGDGKCELPSEIWTLVAVANLNIEVEMADNEPESIADLANRKVCGSVWEQGMID